MKWLWAFVAGFVSTLVFHQGLFQLLHLAGVIPMAAWNMKPVGPLGLPSVVSLALWAGLWGVALWALIRNAAGASKWMWGFVWGALGPSLVALFIVLPLKGMPLAGGFKPAFIVMVLLLNGMWGLGVVALMKLYKQDRAG